MAAVAATAAVPGDGGAGEVEPMPGSEAGADALPAGTQAAVESAVLDAAREDPEPAPGGEAQQPPSPPPKSPAGPRDLPQAQPNPGPAGEPLQPLSLTATLSGHSEKEEAEEQPPQPGLPLVPPLLLAAGGPAGPEPGEEPPRPEEEEPDAAVAAAARTTASVAKQPELSGAAGPGAAGAAGEEEALLLPGSEVLVTLDHIIEDALVVSFRFGEKLFSGVLMDLSKSSETLIICCVYGIILHWHEVCQLTRNCIHLICPFPLQSRTWCMLRYFFKKELYPISRKSVCVVHLISNLKMLIFYKLFLQ